MAYYNTNIDPNTGLPYVDTAYTQVSTTYTGVEGVGAVGAGYGGAGYGVGTGYQPGVAGTQLGAGYVTGYDANGNPVYPGSHLDTHDETY